MADTISAAGGDDHVIGGDGDDSLVGGSGDDVLEGGWGYDFLSGNSGTDLLSRGNWNDELRGREGDDRLLGGSGFDELIGGEGSDVFVLGDGLLLAGAVFGAGLATIDDFQADFPGNGTDLLEVSAAVFGTTDFDLVVGPGGPTTGETTFLFNPATEFLAFDRDGTGSAAAVTIAQLLGVETLSVSDFLIV